MADDGAKGVARRAGESADPEGDIRGRPQHGGLALRFARAERYVLVYRSAEERAAEIDLSNGTPGLE